MIDNNEINKILETTKKKIAIFQFKKERVEEMKDKHKNRFSTIKKTMIATAAGIILTVGSVGAYVGITGNTELLEKFGINIGQKYEDVKEYTEGATSNNGYTIELVSAACDSTCIILETEIKTDDNSYKDIDFKIDSLTLTGDNITGSTNAELKLSDNSSSSITENGTIKLFKYISIKDPNLGGDGFLDELFKNQNKATCKIEISKLIDKNTNETISEGNWNFDFTLNGKEKSNYTQMEKTIEINDVIVNIEYASQSSLGNYITLIASQDNFDISTENDIQKLEYIIKNSEGKTINIVSSTNNITVEPNDTSKISIETTLKLDDISKDVNYNIDVKIGDKIIIALSEIQAVIEATEKIEDEKDINPKNEEIQLNIIENRNSKSTDSNEVLLKAPLEKELIILSGYRAENHKGIDLMAQEGDSIYSINKGDVEDVGFNNEIGKYIKINYNNGVKAVYGACSEVLKKSGDKVETGDEIARVGSTGHSTGPHLHFEIIVNGVHKNPEEYMK